MTSDSGKEFTSVLSVLASAKATSTAPYASLHWPVYVHTHTHRERRYAKFMHTSKQTQTNPDKQHQERKKHKKRGTRKQQMRRTNGCTEINMMMWMPYIYAYTENAYKHMYTTHRHTNTCIDTYTQTYKHTHPCRGDEECLYCRTCQSRVYWIWHERTTKDTNKQIKQSKTRRT